MKNSKFTWSYLASFLRITSSILIYPIILDKLSVQEVGIWGIFQVFIFLGVIIDFGFNSSFSRNFSYAYAGSITLQKIGVSTKKQALENITLLRSLIFSTHRFYRSISILVLILFIPLGSYYLLNLGLINPEVNTRSVIISWLVLATSIAYGLYTHRYESLLVGRDMITLVKIAQILGSICYLLLAFLSAFMETTILGLCFAHMISNIVIRNVYYYGGYKSEVIRLGYSNKQHESDSVLNTIAPNAVRTGITSIGGFLVTKSGVLIAGLYLPLKDVAIFTLTQQAVGVLAGLGTVYAKTIFPSLNVFRINQNIIALRKEYFKSTIMLFVVFLVGGVGLVYWGNYFLNFLTTEIDFLQYHFLIGLIIITLLESNHSVAGLFLTTKNIVPFFLPSVFSGMATLILFFVFFEFCDLGIISLILAPGLVQLLYQNWKWPFEVYKDFYRTV